MRYHYHLHIRRILQAQLAYVHFMLSTWPLPPGEQERFQAKGRAIRGQLYVIDRHLGIIR